MQNKKLVLTKICTAVFIVCLLVLLFLRIALAPRVFKKSQLLMGTVVTITVIDRDPKKAREACRLAFKEMRRIEKLFSVKDKSSAVSKVNNYQDLEFFKTNPEIIFLLKESRKISEMTQGAFDVSVGPLVELWKRKLKNNETPSEKEIQENLALVNYRNIEIDEQKNLIRFKKRGMKIEPGAIAKGYAVDEAVKIVKEKGIRSCLIEAGGDLFALGKNLKGKDWLVGVKHPRAEGLILELTLSNKGAATSGDYERFKMLNKKRYHHLLNPITGFPAEKNISVTIIASKAMLADGLSTAIFVLGEKKGMELIKKTKGASGIIIVEENEKIKIFTSKTLKKNIGRKKSKKFLNIF